LLGDIQITVLFIDVKLPSFNKGTAKSSALVGRGGSIMKARVWFLSLLGSLLWTCHSHAQPIAGIEVVMSPGMKITATTPLGSIAITAVDELTRSYTWDGATRTVQMTPRTERWHGSLGLFSPGAGEHWPDHHGITRCVTQEGQQHFKTAEEALQWIRNRDWWPFVYQEDGLMIGWNKNLSRHQLSVEVWQIFINGERPKHLPGSQTSKIAVEFVETETIPLVKAVARDDVRSIAALLAQGVEVNVRNSVGVPVLVMAIRHGSSPCVDALLKGRADPNVRDVDTDLPALTEALERPDIAKLLIAAGADVNASSRKEGDSLRGMTPLMFAVLDGRAELVDLLLERGANVNLRTPSGSTALSLAKQSGLEENGGLIRKLEAAEQKGKEGQR
jgi:uncharacterized protein